MAYSRREVVGVARKVTVHHPISGYVWAPIGCSKEDCGGPKSVIASAGDFDHGEVVSWEDNAGQTAELVKRLPVPSDIHNSLPLGLLISPPE